ncbi:MAG TPA: protein-tyrosine-phosphatase [Verrucomicrobiae bacterium]|nr:protein-tyrosine-phosphatase [Verrucomicrobiae bacterium]
MNQWRSPTAEALYRNDPRLEVRSAGIRASAKRQISQRDVAWAEVIMVMEREHKKWIEDHFRGMLLPPIINLDITASMEFMDANLQGLLREAIDPELEALWPEAP